MYESLRRSVKHIARWIPFALLLFTLAKPGIWGPLWSHAQQTGTAISNHADCLSHELSHELTWRLMNGSI
jgi:hypothetical protein